ncbi:hypothetical protein EVA_05135 [gut metagenome]|uniref:Uncharacterized protein n=1 Tax=gut metagenome TaxID=749906 RepID=J9D2B8_9ZZZZ
MFPFASYLLPRGHLHPHCRQSKLPCNYLFRCVPQTSYRLGGKAKSFRVSIRFLFVPCPVPGR